MEKREAFLTHRQVLPGPQTSHFGQQKCLEEDLGRSAQQQKTQINDEEGYKKFCKQMVKQFIIESPSSGKEAQIKQQTINNLKLLLMVIAAGGVIYLIWDYINHIIIGYMVGLAYHQTESRFIDFVTGFKAQPHLGSKCVKGLKIIVILIFVFLLPTMRSMLSSPLQFEQLNMGNIVDQFKSNRNLTVILCQIIALIYIFYLAIGTYVNRALEWIKPTNIDCLSYCFGICIFMMIFLAFILIPVVFINEVGEVGTSLELKLEEKLQCVVVPIYEHNSLPFCSDKLANNNAVINMIKQQLQEQNQTRIQCKNAIDKVQLNYLGYEIFHYDEIVCTWYSIINKAFNYSQVTHITTVINPTNILSTGTTILSGIFGKLTSLLWSLSNLFFCLTLFITTFRLTTKLKDPYCTVKTIFPQFSLSEKKLIISITTLVHATCLIVFWHFIISMFLLELFNFTRVNLIVSGILSSMAFIPIFRPWFGITFVSILRMIFLGEYYVSLAFSALYYMVSQNIYAFYYKKVGIHQILTNMSVIFGFYQFGLSGIFYGPLILLVCQYAFKQLFQTQN